MVRVTDLPNALDGLNAKIFAAEAKLSELAAEEMYVELDKAEIDDYMPGYLLEGDCPILMYSGDELILTFGNATDNEEKGGTLVDLPPGLRLLVAHAIPRLLEHCCWALSDRISRLSNQLQESLVTNEAFAVSV